MGKRPASGLEGGGRESTMSSPATQRSPQGAVTAAVWKGMWWLMTSLPPQGNYPCLQLRYPINLHKAMTMPLCILLIFLYDRVTPATCVYTAVHGTYGILWLAKEVLYRDAIWGASTSLGSAVYLFLSLGISYWSSPYLLITGGAEDEPCPVQLGVIVTTFILGNWLHHSADVQKHFVLRARKGLITDGLFCRSRNPNYLGEMMLYGSFAAFVWRHPLWWFPWIGLAVVWSCLFYPNWQAKDKSMSRYPQWAKYTAVTGLILPWPFGKREGL